ncbi:MAG: DNA repair protein RecO [Candidatus Moraniibacteriota bacterium]|nr:MAG: DNA repair protein RecO [Candidatus Moranbacteria bacterium]
MDFSYTAIVLGKRDIGETDRLYTFFTQEGGKVKAMGRGSRKPAAKLAGHLETLSLIDLSIARSRGRGNISSAVVENMFPHIRRDEVSLRTALEAVSIIDRRMEDGEVDAEVFLLLLGFLRALEIVSALPRQGSDEVSRFSEKVFLLSQGFLWKFLDRLGYRIEVRRCAAGQESLVAGERYCFSPDLGGIVCSRHREGARLTLPFGENAVKFLRLLFVNSLTSLPKLSVDRETAISLRRALKSFLDWTG